MAAVTEGKEMEGVVVVTAAVTAQGNMAHLQEMVAVTTAPCSLISNHLTPI